jgi:hypothetical protein
MIGVLRHNHLRQQARARVALLDRLGWLGRRFHRAGASVLLANILDHDHLSRDKFVALARFFPDRPQILRARRAVFFTLGQIVDDAFALQMRRHRTAAPRLTGFRAAGRRCRRIVVLIAVLVLASRLFQVHALRLQFRCEQRQLIRGKLLASAPTFGLQQLLQ